MTSNLARPADWSVSVVLVDASGETPLARSVVPSVFEGWRIVGGVKAWLLETFGYTDLPHNMLGPPRPWWKRLLTCRRPPLKQSKFGIGTEPGVALDHGVSFLALFAGARRPNARVLCEHGERCYVLPLFLWRLDDPGACAQFRVSCWGGSQLAELMAPQPVRSHPTGTVMGSTRASNPCARACPNVW